MASYYYVIALNVIFIIVSDVTLIPKQSSKSAKSFFLKKAVASLIENLNTVNNQAGNIFECTESSLRDFHLKSSGRRSFIQYTSHLALRDSLNFCQVLL